MYNFSVYLLNNPCQELSYEISGDNAALYIIIFFLIENFTMAIALTAANLKTLLADRPQYALGRIVIPNIPVCDGAVYVSGDSMYPILKSGDIVGFKSIRDFTDVIYVEMYLVSFERGGDEYLAVKYVNHSERPDCIRLVSYGRP